MVDLRKERNETRQEGHLITGRLRNQTIADWNEAKDLKRL